MDIKAFYETLPARYPELRGQVAIITGAGRRIGLGIAARLAKEGMRLVMGGLNAEELAAAVDTLRSLGAEIRDVAGDVRDPAVLDALFAAANDYGRLDLLVNNAADLRRFKLEKLTEQLIDDQIAVNIRAPMLASLRAVEMMKAAGSGSIVNITSVGGIRAQYPGLPYGMTKGALEMFTRNLAIDAGEHGIRVNAIAPGWTPPPQDEPDEGYRNYLADVSKLVPLHRPGTMADMAAAVAYLASPDAAYVTGHTLVVDGGITAQLHPPQYPI